jgi:hypothetical protein
MLLQRIGNLMDTALNNRQASNPYEPSKGNPHRVLYPPTGLVAHTGNQTLKLTWLAADSDIHLRYEVDITSIETGVTETKTTYTNELRYKNVNGAYSAKVKSVGRNGASSTIETIDFTMGGSVMQIEGSKNGPTELGTIVQDHITIYDGYSVYVWGSVVLDKFVAGESNEPAVFQLWSMEGANQTFNSKIATLQQTVTMYPATESFSNLDDNAHGGDIERPFATRPGSFETSQSVMFSPISIGTDQERTISFFLLALGRVVEQDEVNLSIVLWGGFDGLGDNVPQDPWDGGRSNLVFPHLHSLSLWRREMSGSLPVNFVTQGSWYLAQQPRQFNIIDNSWTLAFWIRLESEHINVMTGQVGENAFFADQNIIFRRNSYSADSPWNWNENAIEVSLIGVIDNGRPPGATRRMYVKAQAWDADGTTAATMQVNTPTFGASGSYPYPGEIHDPDGLIWDPPIDGDMNSYLWANNSEWIAVGAGWLFFVICYEGGPDTSEFGPFKPKIRMYSNNRLVDPGNKEDRYIPSNMMECTNQRVADGKQNTEQSTPAGLLKEINQDITNDYIYSIGCNPTGLFQHGEYHGPDRPTQNGTFAIHQAGMWNVAIDNWDGMGFNVGIDEIVDSSPWYDPENLNQNEFNPNHEDGRQSFKSGSSLTAIHYLFNQGYATDINWLKNSNIRVPDGATEYPFAENLVHLWQFGAVADEYAEGAETLRDTGNFMYGGDVNFLSQITTGNVPGGDQSTNSWHTPTNLSDINSPTRTNFKNPYADDGKIYPKMPPVEWGVFYPGVKNWIEQNGIIQPEGHVNGAGYSDAGTTAWHLAYPGFAFVMSEAGWNGAGTSVGWRRPNTTDGVLDEPKTYGPVRVASSLEGAENAWGASEWPVE